MIVWGKSSCKLWWSLFHLFLSWKISLFSTCYNERLLNSPLVSHLFDLSISFVVFLSLSSLLFPCSVRPLISSFAPTYFPIFMLFPPLTLILVAHLGGFLQYLCIWCFLFCFFPVEHFIKVILLTSLIGHSSLILIFVNIF